MEQINTIKDIKKNTAINKLIETKNISKASKELDLSRSTLNRWLKEKEFKAELINRANEITGYSFIQLKLLFEKSITNYFNLLNSTDIKLKRQVSKDIIDLNIKLNNIIKGAK